jgi:hypothetical protein
VSNIKKYNIKENKNDDASIIGVIKKMRRLLIQMWEKNKTKSQYPTHREVNKQTLQRNNIRYLTGKETYKLFTTLLDGKMMKNWERLHSYPCWKGQQGNQIFLFDCLFLS